MCRVFFHLSITKTSPNHLIAARTFGNHIDINLDSAGNNRRRKSNRET